MAESDQKFLEQALEQYPDLRIVLDRYDHIDDDPVQVEANGQAFRWDMQYGDLDATFDGSFGFILPGVELDSLVAHDLGEQVALVSPSNHTKLTIRAVDTSFGLAEVQQGVQLPRGWEFVIDTRLSKTPVFYEAIYRGGGDLLKPRYLSRIELGSSIFSDEVRNQQIRPPQVSSRRYPPGQRNGR